MQLCETAHLDESCWAGDADGEATCRESCSDLEVQWCISLEVLAHVEVAHLMAQHTCSMQQHGMPRGQNVHVQHAHSSHEVRVSHACQQVVCMGVHHLYQLTMI